MNKKHINDDTRIITHQLPQLAIARFLVVLLSRGMTREINYFNSLKEAKQAFGEIAYDYGYEPREINGSCYYDVSIWKWTEDRYKKVFKK